MKKLKTTVIASALLALSLCNVNVQAVQSNGISVKVDGQEIAFDQQPIIYGDFTLVPIRGVFETMGAEVEWEQASQTVTVKKEDTTITLKQDSKDVFINTTLQKLDTIPQLVNNRIMVPLRFISESLDAKVDWDDKTRTVNISQQNLVENDSKALQEWTLINTNNNESLETLSYEEALKKAISYSYALKNAEKEIDRAQESRDDYGEYFRYSSPFGTGNSAEEAQIRQLYLGLLSADDKLRKAKRDVETTKEEVQYQVKQAYNDIIQKQATKAYNERALLVEQLNARIAKVQLDQGLISQVQYEQLQNKLESTEKTLEASEKGLAQATVKLNQLIGSKSNQEYNLVDQPSFEVMEDVDVDFHITKTLEVHPTIFEIEQAKKLAEDAVKFHSFNPNSIGETYQTKKINITTLGNQLGQAKDSIAEGVRSTYLNIKSLEDQYAILQTNLSNAEKNLQVAKSQYQLGQTTEFDLRQKELEVANLESRLIETVVTLDNLRAVFEKPWVAMGTTSSAQ